jgi:hypothetical protein
MASLATHSELKKHTERIARHFSNLPSLAPNESPAVALRSPKTAALFFDRVWGGLDMEIPRHIAFWGAGSNMEIGIAAMLAMMTPAADDRSADSTERDPEMNANADAHIPDATRVIAEEVSAARSSAVIPVYSSNEDRDREYAAGDRAALVAIVDDLQVVSEHDLTWEQVVALRADHQSRFHLLRMRHWLDREMAGKSRSFVEDEIALRLYNYERALQEHGVSTVIGTLASTLDSKVLLGGPAAIAARSYAGIGAWALFAGAGIVVSKVAIHFAEQMLSYGELREGSEICFLAAIKRRSAA